MIHLLVVEWPNRKTVPAGNGKRQIAISQQLAAQPDRS